MAPRFAAVACATCVGLIAALVTRGDVGLMQVTPDRCAELSDRLHVAVGPATREPDRRDVFVSGPIADGVVVSATLIIASVDGKERIRVPIRVVERPSQESARKAPAGDPPAKKKEWYLSCQLDREMAAAATIDVLLDVPSRNVGTVYRVAVADFLDRLGGGG